jgi:hypothetical protein
MFYSETKKITFNGFSKRYCELIETRLLCDFEISEFSKTYQSLKQIFDVVCQLRIDPQKFMDYCFIMSDGLPFSKRIEYFLKSYKEKTGTNLLVTIYDKVERDIENVLEQYQLYDSLMQLYVLNHPSPFLPASDEIVKLYMWRRCVPEIWERLDVDEEYFNQVCVAFFLLDKFKHMRRFLKEKWLPVLKKIRG